MDAVKFLREFSRMCSKHYICQGCPVKEKSSCVGDCKKFSPEDQERIVEVVEKWSKENSEEIGKKYIIEIDMVGSNGFLYRIKGTDRWLGKSEIRKLEEYNESEE